MSSIAIIDSQSVKSAHPSSMKGIDGGKKVKGIKRHIIVDERGIPLDVSITQGNIHDSKAAYGLVGKALAKYSSINLIKADNGYRRRLIDVILSYFGVEIRCVKSNFGQQGFRPLDGRWVVERTFAWIDTFRRLCRNYEHYLKTAESMLLISIIMLLIRKL